MFRLLTPVTYWVLIVLWSFILFFYVRKLHGSKTQQLFYALVLILAIDAFRTLFESVYFGLWYTSLSGIIPLRIGTFLTRPELVIIPKIINVIAAVVVIVLLLKRWLPKEEQEQERVLETLRESENRYFSLFARNHSVMLLLDPANGEIIDANPAACNYYGYSFEELLAKNITEINVLPKQETLEKLAEIQSDKNNYFQFQHTLANGERRDVEIYSGPIYLDDRQLIYSTIHDITDRKQAEYALHKRDLQYRSILQSTMEGFWIVNSIGRIIDANNKICEMLGYTRGELLTMSISDIEVEETTQETIQHIQKIITSGYDRFESRHRKKNGEVLDVEVSSTYLPEPNAYFCTFIRDITESKRAEETLRESEEKYRQLFEGTSIGIGISDASGHIRIMNDAMQKISGFSAEDLKQVSVKDTYVNPDDRKVILKLLKEYGKVENFDVQLSNGKGQLYWANISISPIKFKGEDLFLTCKINIDDRKRAEQALEKRVIALTRSLDDVDSIEFDELFKIKDIQRLQDQFAHATGVASIITRPDGTPITVGSNFCRMCNDIIRKTEKGLLNCNKSDEILGRHNPEGPNIQPCLSCGLWDAGAAISIGGKHIANWLIGQVRDETQSEDQIRAYAHEIGVDEEHLAKAFQEVPSMSREQFERVAQTLFTLANNLSTLAYQNIQQARFISELKQSQEEQKKLQTQLNQAQKMEAIGTLAGGIAHDFNNILAAIIGYTEMARDDSPSESTVVKNLNKVLEAGDRAKGLVQQILAFSRQGETECIPLQLAKVVNDAIKILRPSLPATIEIHQNSTSTTGLILADPTQIHQILMNLCTNAFHAMEETGGNLDISLNEVTLGTEDLVHEPDAKAGTFVQLSISDSGPGIATDIKKKIFDPYFTTKEVGKGTGMGLAIVHGIVKSYGGFISIDSEFGQGTTFHVLLPTIETETLSKIEVAEQIPIGKERILFVDDEEILAEMGKDILERLGYHVTIKNCSLEALEIFEKQSDKFDLIITDQTMPGMTGAELAKRMIQIRPDIPIILCTGYSTVISKEKTQSIGIKELALKPLSKKNIAVLIRKVLD